MNIKVGGTKVREKRLDRNLCNKSTYLTCMWLRHSNICLMIILWFPRNHVATAIIAMDIMDTDIMDIVPFLNFP